MEEGEHISYYDVKWLRENCYTLKNKKYNSPYIMGLFFARKIDSIKIDHDKILNSDRGLIKWLELLHHKGIAIVKNVSLVKNLLFHIK